MAYAQGCYCKKSLPWTCIAKFLLFMKDFSDIFRVCVQGFCIGNVIGSFFCNMFRLVVLFCWHLCILFGLFRFGLHFLFSFPYDVTCFHKIICNHFVHFKLKLFALENVMLARHLCWLYASPKITALCLQKIELDTNSLRI